MYKNQKEVSEQYHMHQTEAPVTVTNNKLALHMKNQEICGFALLDSNYVEKVKSKAEKEEDERVRQHLCNTLEPLTRSMLMKKMEIVGWSQNLLENASGQVRQTRQKESILKLEAIESSTMARTTKLFSGDSETFVTSTSVSSGGLSVLCVHQSVAEKMK